MSLLLRTHLIRHPPSIHVLSGADATPGETRDAKTEYISRMPETTLPEPPSGPQPGRWVLSHGEIRTIVFGLMLAMFLAALNQTVATALPTIGRDFRDFELLPWVVTAYLLSSTVVAPLYGKLSDIHGRRAMMLAAVGIFTAGSIACALAPDMIMLILGRALQGIGGGGVLPLAQSIPADAVAPRERGHYQAYMGSVWVTAGLGGPVIGGILAEHFHWSIIFWFNVPLGLIAAVMAQRSLKRLPRHERKHKLDLLGAGLMTAAAIPLLLALTWGGTRYPWLSVPIAALILASAVLSVLFVWRLLSASEPFLPMPILANPVMRMGTVCTSFSQGVVIGLTIFLPLYYEVVHKFGEQLRPRAHSHRGDVDARIDPGGPRHDGPRSLQARAGVRARLLDRGALGPGVEPGDAADLVVGDPERRRVRHRHHLSSRCGLNPERRVALSGRGRDGGDELLSRADGGVHRGGHGRRPAGDARRCARTRRARHRHERNGGKRARRRSRACLPGCVRAGGGVPDRKSDRASSHGGAAVARPQRGHPAGGVMRGRSSLAFACLCLSLLLEAADRAIANKRQTG